jgi:DNA-binding CsgD family transcriptional regulator/Flp pilus assembly protein TadD
MDGLLERDRELAALDRLVADAEGGRGRLALIEGPAGIGKSRLLAELRERVEGRMTVLAARCGELERDFSFGAVRQLLEPVTDRERLLAGAAAPAAGVLETLGETAEGTFAVLHGLYWAVLNLAEEQPVLLAVDDVQWSDRPSLRFLAYLVRRLEGAPVLVAATLRSTEPGTDPTLIAELGADPLCEAVRPAPLGDGAVTELITAQIGEPDPRFAAACREATGGNPLLLRHLLGALDQDGVAPSAAGAAAVREIGHRAVSRTVLLRLSRLPGDAAAVARAVAVLGDSSGLPAVAALAGLDEATVARAAGELARADILRAETPLGYVHPLVRDAVYLDIPAGERELLHGRAAEVLDDTEEVAAQLLHAPRRGDRASVELLRAAAREAGRRGGPDSALAYLGRALEEPPPAELRGQIHFELGVAAAEMNAPTASEHLRVAYDSLTDPEARATAAFALAQSLLFTGHPAEGGALARRAAAEAPADARAAIEGVELIAVFFGHDRDALTRIGPAEGTGLGARMLTAAHAFADAAGGAPAADCEALALESLEDGQLLASVSGLFWSAALVALILSGSPRAAEWLSATRSEAYRAGSVFSISSAEMWSGVHLLGLGELEDAGVALAHAMRMQDPWGSAPAATGWARGLLAYHAVLTGDTAGARGILGAAPAPGEESDGANLWRRAQAELLLAEGRPDEALAVAELMGRTAVHVRHPDWKPWQSLRARALARLGQEEEALAAIEAELALARETGVPATIGRCLRERAELAQDLEGLREAASMLATTPARLEHARALAALGAALRRDRQATEAREPLREALELAEACACPPLVESVRAELYASGARPRTTALSGVASLTASERRVASLAAEGQTNREIAQALFVTPKTVEVHLSNAYRKLDIRSRRELPGALA